MQESAERESFRDWKIPVSYTHLDVYKRQIKNTGRAVITINAAAASGYKAATKKVIVTVTPKKAAISKLRSAKKGSLKISWKKDARATGYQVVIAKNKAFTSGKKTAAVTKAKTTSKTFTKLSAKKTYYAKVRAYKTISGKKVYGAYSLSLIHI